MISFGFKFIKGVIHLSFKNKFEFRLKFGGQWDDREALSWAQALFSVNEQTVGLDF